VQTEISTRKVQYSVSGGNRSQGQVVSNIVFGPFSVSFSTFECFSGKLYETTIRKEEAIETDIAVFANIRMKYYEAINPWNRWTIHSQRAVRAGRRIKRTIVVKEIISFLLVCQSFLWYWMLGPVYRAVNLWDLKEIHEVNLKVYKWPEDQHVEAEFSSSVINPKYGPRQWKAIFDNPHRNGINSVFFRDQLPTTPKQIMGDKSEVVGLLFKHKLIIFRVIIMCLVGVILAIVTTVLIGQLTDQGYAVALAAGACVIAVVALGFAALSLIVVG